MSEARIQDAPVPGPGQLDELLAAYGQVAQVAERLKASHDGLQEQVERLREQLAAKDRQLERRKRLAALGEMAAGLAHEIRNPLGGIQLCASMLETDLEQMPRAQEMARKIGYGVCLLERIVRDVLAFARQSEPDPVPVAVGQLVRMGLLYAADKLEHYRCGVEIEDGLDDLAVLADPEQVSRALLNLMVNAAQATEGLDGGGVLRIGPVVDAPGALAGVRLVDNGCGIVEDLLERVFDPFFSTRDEGTGLGLAIVHRIFEAHNGRIAVRSELGVGTEISCYLPLAERAAQTRAEERT
jgi:signal transduction histidine kinase